jgi:hypothetical protein
MKAHSVLPAGTIRRRLLLATVTACAGSLAVVALAAGSAVAQDPGPGSPSESAESPAASEARPVPFPFRSPALERWAQDNGFPGDKPPQAAPWATERGKGFALRRRDNNCPDGYSCMWNYVGFEGTKKYALPGQYDDGWHYFPGWWNFSSAKNRFNNRRFQVADQHITRCLNPGDNRPSLDASMYYYNVGASGSRC